MRPRCPNCDGLLRHDPADILGHERVTCTICGWFKLREEAAPAAEEPTPEETPVPKRKLKPSRTLGTCSACDRPDMMVNGALRECSRCSKIHTKNTRGTCPLCKRENVLLTSKNGECHRCRKRIEAGHDPLLPARSSMPTGSTPYRWPF